MAYIPGTEKGEILNGTREDDVIEGAGGDDELYGDAGIDHLTGGEGADHLDGGADFDAASYDDSPVGVAVDLSSGKGHFGTAEGDTLVSIERVDGSAHADLLIGGGQADTLYGSDGNDTLKGMGGTDFLIGDDGIDTASYDESPQGVQVVLGSVAHFGDAEGDQLYEIENLSGSDHRDILGGDRGANILWGMSGNDHLAGSGGDDTLHGGWGDDDLWGDEGNDTLWGENGNDTFVGGLGVDTMMGGPGDDTYFVGWQGDDVVIESGGQGVDVVNVYASWTLTEGADVETLQAWYEDGTDPLDLTGNSSGNTVRGNAGSNVINGGGGNDELIGLGGTDGFRFDTALDPTFNVDLLPDFDVEDVIQLDDAVFGALATGVLAAERFVIGTAAQDADDNIIYDDVTGNLLYDSDGAGGAAAIQFAQANPGLGISNQDFIVV